MRCAKCGHDNRTGAKFCEECGAQLKLACGGCGAQLSPAAKFCSECGLSAGQRVSPSPTSQPRFSTPESYTPRHLAERILTSKTAIEGERKQVTALFADLKGSMELFADRDPEEARRLLDPVIEHMMEAVHRYEGTVNHVLGDGIVALFGAPLAHEDHAIRACYAALRMQETVKVYAEGVRRSEGIPIQIRVGLNSGEVVVRSIGSDLRMDYTVVGQTTNVAARMEQMAVPGSILISADTLSLAEGYVQVNPLGPLKVKGLERTLDVYEVTGASTARSRLHAAAARGLSRFVGRDGEIEQLLQALERARNGHGQVVAVVGDPGVGKSRLYWEFTRSHRTQGWRSIESSSVSYGKATAFLPIIDLLRSYFQIEARDEARKVREKAIGRLLSLDRSLESAVPAMLWLLEVPVDDPQWQRLDPPQRRQRALDAVKRLLLRESQVQPLLVMFEDLHWIDLDTQALLDSLVESLPTARLLLLVNYRPEYQHTWSGKSYYRQLSIAPLPPESADELLEALLGSDASLRPLKKLLIERTDGNPFFLEESVRTLIETNALAGNPGSYRLAKAPQALQIPATAQAILAARIDRLDTDDKRLLQAASVLGKDVPFLLLQSIAEGSEEALRRGLANLQAAEFLYEARLFPDLEYTFKHALTHNVAYASLLQERRRVLHARIVSTIEALYPDSLMEHIERLADHAFRGEVWGKALGYLRQAGAKAFARSANREAVAYLERAISALAHLPETPETLAQAIDLRFDLRSSLFTLGELDATLDCLRDTERLAKALGDPRRLGWWSAFMCQFLWVMGRVAEARPYGERALEIAEGLDDPVLQAVANYYVGAVHFSMNAYRRSAAFLRRATGLLEGDLGRERFGLAGYPAVMARWLLSSDLGELGEFDEGLREGQTALRIAEEVDHPYSLILALWGLAHVRSIQGDLPRAAADLERALAHCREWNVSVLVPVTSGFLGYVYVLSGQLKEGLSLLNEGLKAQESGGISLFRPLLLVRLSEALMLADRIEAAESTAEQALALARGRGERGAEAWALRALGEIASVRDLGSADAADSRYREALALAEELEMRPLAAHCHHGLGRLRDRSGNNDVARGT
jgi:class 3 adenylate cyclase